MTTEQKDNIVAAQTTEAPVLLIELNADQIAVSHKDVLNLSTDELQDMAARAFNSALKGKLQSAVNMAIKAKYIAEGKGRKALAEECEKEIQAGLKLIRSL